MHIFIMTLALLFSQQTFAREADVVVQTRFNKEWSARFIEQVRAIIITQGAEDPYERTLEKPLIFDLGPTVAGLSKPSQEWYKALLKYMKIDLIKSDFSLVIDQFHYKIEGIDAAISPSAREGGLILKTVHNVEGLGLSAGTITLQVALHSTNGQPIMFNIDLVNPSLSMDQIVLPLKTEWNSSITALGLGLVLEKVDLREALREMQRRLDRVQLDVDDIVVPNVQVRVGDRTVTVDRVKLRNWVLSQKESLKGFILDVIVLKNIDRFEDPTGDEDPVFNLPKEIYAATETISGALSLDAVTAQNDHMRGELNGVFCLPKVATDYKSCRATAPQNPRAERQGRNAEASFKKIYEDLEKNNANIIVSLSEPYINQALTAAIKSGMFDDAFEDGVLSLAPGGALTQLDRPGQIFYGHLHLHNRLFGWERRLTGRSLLTFPVKVGLQLKLEQKEGVPHLYIDVVEADAPLELLMKGLPQMGMASNVATVPRFRGTVIEKIQKGVKTFRGQRLVELPLEFLKGTFLEKVQLQSDGFGRANALFKVEEKRLLP